MKTYEQLYKEALKRARTWKEKSGMPEDKQGILDDIFPELKKSEDELVREELIHFLDTCQDTRLVANRKREKWIEWLEKQINVIDKNSYVEQPSEALEEEFTNYCVHGNIRNPNFEGPFGYDDIRKTAIHFANWQKEQLMKSAIDATVSGGGCHISLVPEKDIPQICKGDRVKIIIVKEDELPVGNKNTSVRFPSFEESQGEFDSYSIVLNG